jgi:hypothetical protein
MGTIKKLLKSYQKDQITIPWIIGNLKLQMNTLLLSLLILILITIVLL